MNPKKGLKDQKDEKRPPNLKKIAAKMEKSKICYG